MLGLRHATLAFGLTATLLLSACGSDDDSAIDDTGPAPEFDFSAFDAEVQAFVDETGLEGVGTVVVHRDYGVIHQKSFGSFTDDRIYLVASSSKMVSAGVLMHLDDQGILDVDEPIIDAVGWGDSNPDITPAQLISNSSGLVGLLPNPAYPPYICQYLAAGSLRDCAQQIFTTELDDADIVPPDTMFIYGGGQWQVAGGVAEAVSGKSWDQLIEDIYVDPCGLEATAYTNHFTTLTSPGNNPFGYPSGFDGDPANLTPTDNPNIEGGLYTTTGDYAKLLLMHLRGGLCGDNRVLSEEAVQAMHADRIAMAYDGSTGRADPAGYGLGWWIFRDADSLITDPGAYGAFPWLDEDRGYGAFLAIEANTGVGTQLFVRVLPLADAAVDAGVNEQP